MDPSLSRPLRGSNDGMLKAVAWESLSLSYSSYDSEHLVGAKWVILFFRRQLSLLLDDLVAARRRRMV